MTYAALAALFVAATAVVAGLVSWRRRLGAAWWATTALTILGLLLLTVVFDSLMIAVDLFRYDEAQLLGWSVGLAPIEDLAWPVAAGLLLPSLWELLARPADDGERERSSR
ncbi:MULTISPECIES: lycopene cyclase domain-containing protein [Kocuria]|jgi:lycopene cyclase domain-containing protein|uniref:lycopene cyclase domain-containing protein n=1 Tax=Kocuria TaxID=57493 RepID=UPI0021A72211|nr:MULTISPECIES: lycopene cyclase domain-containing protein [Kocuria]MCT1589447.1 lycopene cyclase domain-containing protein [Kocuria palustris]MCT1600882.1 lycopene cyclase domain-containing protein [Kocuria sp. p3-SID1428]MCT2179157.1 lycopene cyclase domain-containing protein [Kocuria sp. p3-SID1433]